MRTQAKPAERSIVVDGLNLRYIELGEGPAVLFLHGASLGSSADVFLRNLPPFADAGFRALAFDQPGFGLSDLPTDHSSAFRRTTILRFMDALGLSTAALVGHSQAGAPAVQIALQTPSRVSHVIVLGTGGLLPPSDANKHDAEGAAQQRLERRMARVEPTLEDTRKLLEANLFHHELITTEELELRHRRSLGKPFEAFCARSDLAERAPPKAPDKPLWTRLLDITVPLLLIYGREDRGRAFDRATSLKRAYPQLDLHIVDGCKHLMPWDAAQDLVRLAVPFLKG